MTDLDTLLARLRDQPAPGDLAAIDAAVLDELSRRKAMHPIGPGAMSIAAACAMAVGIVSTVLPSRPVDASTLSPFGMSPALTPSSLLDAH